MNYSAI